MFVAPRFVDSLEGCVFYHTMELPPFGVVRGHWDLRGRFADYVGGVEVADRSVLDVGAATGYLSFAAEAAGARRVVSFDMSDVRQQQFVPFPGNQRQLDPEAWRAWYGEWMDGWKNAYWLCHRLLGSRAEVLYGDVFALPAELGTFDVVLVGSLLEHLRDPVAGLDSIARRTGGTMVIVTPLVESEERIASFEPRAANPAQDFTWWTWSTGLYREVLAILGFRLERVQRAEYWHEHEGRFEPRWTLVATRA